MSEQKDRVSNLEELARWFLLSVYRHLVGGDWLTPEQSPVPNVQLEKLVHDYLQDRSARQSLLMVLKDSHYRNTLIRFGPTRDHSRLQLSESTIAYRQARTVLQPLLEVTTEKPAEEPTGILAGDYPDRPATANARRAARRAQASLMNSQTRTLDTPDSAESGMSDEEYARLEQALSTASPAGCEATPPRYRNNEDRLSLLSGLLAGTLLFLLVFWLFL